MNRSSRTSFLLVFYVFLLLIVTFLPARAQEKKNLRIVFVSLSWNNQLPYRIAIAKGYFKEQGLTVEQIFVRGGPTAIAALVSGNVEFGSIGGAQAPIRSNARGLDLHILASLSNYTNYTLLGSKEAKSIEELRGKIIGVTGAGAYSDFAIRIFLKRHNIDPDRDVTLRAIGGTSREISSTPRHSRLRTPSDSSTKAFR
jgi:sulfonate transport system substrate-binding protein